MVIRFTDQGRADLYSALRASYGAQLVYNPDAKPHCQLELLDTHGKAFRRVNIGVKNA